MGATSPIESIGTRPANPSSSSRWRAASAHGPTAAMPQGSVSPGDGRLTSRFNSRRRPMESASSPSVGSAGRRARRVSSTRSTRSSTRLGSIASVSMARSRLTCTATATITPADCAMRNASCTALRSPCRSLGVRHGTPSCCAARMGHAPGERYGLSSSSSTAEPVPREAPAPSRHAAATAISS